MCAFMPVDVLYTCTDTYSIKSEGTLYIFRATTCLHIYSRGAKYVKIRGPTYWMRIIVCSMQGHSAECDVFWCFWPDFGRISHL